MTNQPRRVWRNTVCAAGTRCSPPGTVLSRAHIYGYGRSLRPPQGTSIAPRRRAVFRQCFADNPVLFAQVCGRIALARARTPGAADVAERDALRQVLLQAVTERAPRPHVLGLLLRPDDLDQPRV